MEDKFWSSLINYPHTTTLRIYGLSETNKSGILLRLIISGIGTVIYNIAKSLDKMFTIL